MRRILTYSMLFVTCLLAAPRADALESSAVKTPHAEVTLASETNAVEPGKSFRLGLHFKLVKGWHIYWINPGDAGEPPRLELTLPEGANSSDIVWPTPLRIPEGPVMTYGYADEVLLPLTVIAPIVETSFPVEAKANWLVCDKICVPEEGSFHLDIPVGGLTRSPEARLFASTDQRSPGPSPFFATLAPDGSLFVEGKKISERSVADAWFLPDKWGAIDDGAPQTPTITAGKLILTLKRGQTFDPDEVLTGVLVTKDSSGEESFYRISADPSVLTRAGRPASANLGLLTLLAFAFLGGLILNLMPCVFPVLAIKAIGIAELCGQESRAVRAQAASYTLGVLIAFAALGALLLILRAAGSAAGWGFQFQSPSFVCAMAWLFLLVGLNLSGVFEVSGLANVGGTLATRGGHIGSFFTGFLAVLVATPCTAPFMGTAVAVALTLSSASTLLVFVTMGLGLAAPFALLMLSPDFARALPRPGAWMVVLKQALAFPMYAAVAWLLWVISQQTGPDGVLATAAGMVLIGFAAWALGMSQTRVGAWRAAALVATIAAAIMLYDISAAPPAVPQASAEQEPYSISRLAALRAEGKPVFVNMTAAWCITCLLNERVALSSDAVKKAFAERHVAYLKGDWTHADPEITRFLREHDRDGVPLYVLFPPKSADPIVLPQILTAGAVLAELERLESPKNGS
jgi:thiol:disulfide interchange protein/DsbC/DsbD-like thiol-disulfide interchange protein